MALTILLTKVHRLPAGPNVLASLLIPPGRPASSQQTSGQPERSHRSQVIELYKELLYLAREWPKDLRPQIRSAFNKNRHVQSADEIDKLIAHGRYVCREITATYHLRKYRAMKRRYYLDEADRNLEDAIKTLAEKHKDGY